ncbi:hypothetical protein DVH24_017740 [Malus domestica]|uniref:Uncharacterized protein n=1 Tax=Malus domestica TaxID=3750 RepID=A0A498KDQ3_MALDO|nr:hypothetical protein DVH24_017740 [Malus domestica]
MSRFIAKLIPQLNALIISPGDRDHPDGEPDLEAAVPQVPFPTNNLDWAKIIVGFCFTATIGITQIRFQIPPGQLSLPMTFDFLGLSVLLSFTFILVSQLIPSVYYLDIILVPRLFHNFSMFFGVTAFYIFIAIPFSFWFKCAAYSIYVAAFLFVVFCNLHFKKHYKPRSFEHPTPNNSIPPTPIDPAVESSRGGTSTLDDRACTSSIV